MTKYLKNYHLFTTRKYFNIQIIFFHDFISYLIGDFFYCKIALKWKKKKQNANHWYIRTQKTGGEPKTYKRIKKETSNIFINKTFERNKICYVFNFKIFYLVKLIDLKSQK